MTWNYRLVRLNEEDVDVCEVYYDEAGEPLEIAQATLGGTSRQEIEDQARRMLSALDKSVLTVRKAGMTARLEDTGQLL